MALRHYVVCILVYEVIAPLIKLSIAVERLRVMHSVEQRLVNACSAHELSFLALPGYDPTASLPKRTYHSLLVNVFLFQYL